MKQDILLVQQIHSGNIQGQHVKKPYAATPAPHSAHWQNHTLCICRMSANVVLLVTLEQTARGVQ